MNEKLMNELWFIFWDFEGKAEEVDYHRVACCYNCEHGLFQLSINRCKLLQLPTFADGVCKHHKDEE